LQLYSHTLAVQRLCTASKWGMPCPAAARLLEEVLHCCGQFMSCVASGLFTRADTGTSCCCWWGCCRGPGVTDAGEAGPQALQHQAMVGPAGAECSMHTDAAEVPGVLWRAAQAKCHTLTTTQSRAAFVPHMCEEISHSKVVLWEREGWPMVTSQRKGQMKNYGSIQREVPARLSRLHCSPLMHDLHQCAW
jgi:hypothetical protein